MNTASNSIYQKQREIRFDEPNIFDNQAIIASGILTETDGILSVQIINNATILVSYMVDQITLKDIDQLLSAGQLHLSNCLMCKMRRSLYYYTEDNLRQTLDCQHGYSNCTKSIFTQRRKNNPTGCQDNRPQHWRNYH